MQTKLFRALPWLFSAFAACSGGGGGSGSTGSSAPRVGTVNVVVDTSAGADAVIQFQVAAAVLEESGGAQTGNVLLQSQMLTLADPSGEASGLVLTNVPSGDYRTLHLMVVPGSGAALTASGTIVPVTCALDVVVPIVDGLLHSSLANSWLVLGHNVAPPSITAGIADWTPAMAARSDGTAIELSSLQVATIAAPTVAATLDAANDAVLQVGFGDDCSFDDGHGGQGQGHGRDDFLSGTTRDDSLSISGELRRDGGFTARHARRQRGNDGPRLLGRITELRPATSSFVLDMQAEVRRGGERRFLAVRESVLVFAGQARIHHSHSRTAATFGELQVGNLVKVEWLSRTPVAGTLTEVVAREIEFTSGSLGLSPEWEGQVQAVDLANNTIVVEPRHDDPIVVNGTVVPTANLTISAGTVLLRRADHGGGTFSIGLDEIVAGGDRIWWRGTVTGPSTIAASWVRVREE